jgi:Raf kinase inhibitor-like YbhB/YbcL family protein
MRNAYALLGLAFIIVFVGAAVLIIQARGKMIHTELNSSTFTLTSPAFTEGGAIPLEHTCEGANTVPELRIDGVPKATQTLALVVTDPDIPDAVKERLGSPEFDHWIAFNIPPSTVSIAHTGLAGVQGMNSRNTIGYTGPCPPSGTHRYFFTLYALDTTLPLDAGATKPALVEAMAGHILATTTLIGTYEKQHTSP